MIGFLIGHVTPYLQPEAVKSAAETIDGEVGTIVVVQDAASVAASDFLERVAEWAVIRRIIFQRADVAFKLFFRQT